MRLLAFILLFMINLSTFSNSKEISYATNPVYPPYDWGILSSEYSGAGIELLKLVIPKEYKLVPKVIPWARAQNDAKLGNIDLLVNLRITPERETYLDFTTYRAFPNPIAIFVRKDSKIKFDKWDDLKAYTGGVSLGDTFGEGFDEYWPKELKVQVAKNMDENFNKLMARRIDYFVTGYYSGRAYILANNLDSDIKTFEKFISNQDIYFGFSKKSNFKSLIPYISKRLEELDKNGTTDKLLQEALKSYMINSKVFIP